MRRRGLTRKVIEKVCDALSIGATYSIAARYAGFSEAAIYKWLKIGRDEIERREKGEAPDKDKNIYVEFVEQVESAHADYGISLLQIVEKFLPNDPNLAIRMLEKRFPEYRQSTNVDVTSGGEPLKIVVKWGDFADDEQQAD